MANIAASEGISTRSLAFLIARKIGQEGTEGKHIFYDIFEARLDGWIERINIAASKDIKVEAVTAVKQLIV